MSGVCAALFDQGPIGLRGRAGVLAYTRVLRSETQVARDFERITTVSH